MARPTSKVLEVRVAGPLAPFAGDFKARLRDSGYTSLTAVNLMRLMLHLSHRLDARRMTVADLTSFGSSGTCGHGGPLVTGRASEVAGLRLDDIDWCAAEVVVHGKGRRADRAPLPTDAGEAIVGYLRRGVLDRAAYLHPGRHSPGRGAQASPRSLLRRTEKLGGAATDLDATGDHLARQERVQQRKVQEAVRRTR